jgi:quinol monooxygenase YgiN
VYGTVARLRCKPGGLAAVRAWIDVQSQRQTMAGWISTTIYQSDEDPNVVWVAVVFDSRESYHANAATPIQDRLYHQMLTGLEAPPEWHDGDVISHLEHSTPGGG